MSEFAVKKCVFGAAAQLHICLLAETVMLFVVRPVVTVADCGPQRYVTLCMDRNNTTLPFHARIVSSQRAALGFRVRCHPLEAVSYVARFCISPLS